MAALPRSKKRRTSPTSNILTDFPEVAPSSSTISHDHILACPRSMESKDFMRSKRSSKADHLVQQAHQYQQPAPLAPPPSDQASTSSSSRSNRGVPALSSVNEVIGGKVQEVFVLEDDSPPPANPLACQPTNEDLLQGNYTYANGDASYAPGNHHTNGRAQRANANNRGVPAATKGKRKAQGSAPPNGADELSHGTVNGVEVDPSATLSNSASATSKRRKRSHPPQAPIPAYAQNHAVAPPVPPLGAGYMVPAKLPDNFTRRQPLPIEKSYRGGYPAGTTTLDYAAAKYDVEDSASARESYASSSSYVPPPPNCDDKEGHFIVQKGEYVTSRYKIMSQLGQGTFGKVAECFDRKERKYVAIKIIRAVQKYREASQIEIRVLRTLREHDPMNENQCIHLLDTFNFRNHVCIVSELLGKSVFDFLKENSFNPFPAQHIWSFAKQLLKSVAFLHRLNLIHTDLKPENILLVNSDYDVVANSRRPTAKRKHILNNTEIRLIDFGSATFDEEYHSAVVSTRHYRAPEIILQMGWSFPCDVWSIGCILVEFFTGDALFQTHDNLEHLAMMEAVLGPMPDDYRRKAETYKPDLFRGGHLNFPNAETARNSHKYVKAMKKLHDIIPQSSPYQKHNQRFLHLLRRLLEYDPNKRIKVTEALNHPYFDLEPSDFPPI